MSAIGKKTDSVGRALRSVESVALKLLLSLLDRCLILDGAGHRVAAAGRRSCTSHEPLNSLDTGETAAAADYAFEPNTPTALCHPPPDRGNMRSTWDVIPGLGWGQEGLRRQLDGHDKLAVKC